MMHTQECEVMVQDLLVKHGIRNKKVIEAMSKIPRHQFVADTFRARAYGDYTLPIGEGQTISQPYMVALMTEFLELSGSERVLEVGTGCGYQTVVLAELAARVYTIERIKSIANTTQKRIDSMGYLNVVTKIFDGTYGWLSEAPFDRIIITAYAPVVPEMLLQQLDIGGIMVLPVGDEGDQRLVRIRKTEYGIEKEELSSCTFVPLIGEHGWKSNKAMCV